MNRAALRRARLGYREVWRRTGLSARRGGYPRTWGGMRACWRDLAESTPLVLPMGRFLIGLDRLDLPFERQR